MDDFLAKPFKAVELQEKLVVRGGLKASDRSSRDRDRVTSQA